MSIRIKILNKLITNDKSPCKSFLMPNSTGKLEFLIYLQSSRRGFLFYIMGKKKKKATEEGKQGNPKKGKKKNK